MALKLIQTWPSPTLRKPCKPVDPTTELEAVKNLVDDLEDTMFAAGGIGIAAPQIAVLKEIFVLSKQIEQTPDDTITFEGEGAEGVETRGIRAFVNPAILEQSKETAIREEGCLSFPGIYAKIRRPVSIKLSALNELGKPFKVSASGFYAQALHHEFEHLKNVLFVDHLSNLKREFIKKRMKRFRKKLLKK